MKTKGAFRLWMMAALVVMAAMLLAGCGSDLWDDYDYDYDDNNDDDRSSGDGNRTGCDQACLARLCAVSNVWRGPNATIQITSQCQAACSYRETGTIEGVRGTCSNLNAWSRQVGFDAKGSCRPCDGF